MPPSPGSRQGSASQAGLSFLRKVDSTGGSSTTLTSMLFPSSASTQPATLKTSSAGIVQTAGAVEVDAASASGALLSTPNDVYYRLAIAYYDGDPSLSTSNVITSTEVSADATKIASIKYAVVTSSGYVNSTTVAVQSLAGIYQFGWSTESVSDPGGSSGSTAFYGKALQINNQDAWIQAESYDESTSVLTVNDSQKNWWSFTSSSANAFPVQDPRYQVCMVASTDPVTGNIDSTKDAQEDSPIRLFRVAANPANGAELKIQYSEYCQSSGAYKHLNTWIYGDDDSIRLAGTNLCVTGEGDTINMPAKLETCGNGYSP